MAVCVIVSDETEQDRPHIFKEDPGEVLQRNPLKYCFGTKNITPEVRLSTLKIDIGLNMMTNLI